jgi:hypothetical protein
LQDVEKNKALPLFSLKERLNMNLLLKSELEILIKNQQGPSISIFMPTHQVGRETQQNTIRLKNLLNEAKERLTANGLRAPEARDLLEPARALLENGLFWQRQSDDLALFLSSELVRTYQLPLDFEELVVVSDRFYIKPLLPLFSGDGRFYVLALSQNEVRLLQGTRYSIGEIELQDVPASLAEALTYDDPEKQLQFRTDPSSGKGAQTALFHGQGAGADNKRANLLRYFQQIDRGLQQTLQNEQAPLVLAGVEYLFPFYREANTYPYLIGAGVRGNPEEMSAKELHEQAWAIVHPFYQRAQQAAVAQYKQLINSGLASKDIRQIVPAAYYGRIETLFVALGWQQWGAFNPQTNTIHFHGEAEPGDEDLLDAAAVQTLLRGGTVYALKPEKMPDKAPLAAVFRHD